MCCEFRFNFQKGSHADVKEQVRVVSGWAFVSSTSRHRTVGRGHRDLKVPLLVHVPFDTIMYFTLCSTQTQMPSLTLKVENEFDELLTPNDEMVLL